jgi:hypothetical protein
VEFYRDEEERIRFIMNVMHQCALRIEIRRGTRSVSLQVIDISYGITVICLCRVLRLGYTVTMRNVDPLCDMIRTVTSTGYIVYMTTIARAQLLQDRDRINWVFRRNMRNMRSLGYEYLNGRFTHEGRYERFCDHGDMPSHDSSDSEVN